METLNRVIETIETASDIHSTTADKAAESPHDEIRELKLIHVMPSMASAFVI